MTTKTLTLTQEEIEDIRFCLALVARDQEDKALSNIPAGRARALLDQTERFRALARKVTEAD